MIVCIDGPAGSGKSTISRDVAARAGFIHLDTGAYYRALALLADREGVSWDDEAGLSRLAARLGLRFLPASQGQRIFQENTEITDEIRSAHIGAGASKVSRHPRVREILVQAQRDYAADHDVIVEGRDTGTVVFPHAELKIYLDAALEVRARRRMGDFIARGEPADLPRVMADLAARDALDQGRAVGPLAKADDAVVVDTSNMGPEEVIDYLLALIRERHEA